MGRCCQIVMGPAGVGKSTYCQILQVSGPSSWVGQLCESRGEVFHVFGVVFDIPKADGSD